MIDGGAVAKEIWLGAQFKKRPWNPPSSSDPGAVHKYVLRETIASAVNHFGTKSQFVKAMSPLDAYDSDETARNFVQGVIRKFDEITALKEKIILAGHGWLNERVSK